MVRYRPSRARTMTVAAAWAALCLGMVSSPPAGASLPSATAPAEAEPTASDQPENPEAVAALTGIVEMDGGYGHTCARLGNGTAKCWGNNSFGQLGTGDYTPRLTPVTVRNSSGSGPLTGIVEIDTGWVNTCARLADGTARCWGANGTGQVGDGTRTVRPLPTVVKNPSGTGPLTGVAQLTSGDGDTDVPVTAPGEISVPVDKGYTCARLTDGTARCWGMNAAGQLGTGTTTTRLLPTTVKNPAGTGPLTGVTDIAAGYAHSCAALVDGTARCWGANSGALGDGTTISRLRPVTVKNPAGTGPLTGVSRIDASWGSFSCATLTDQTGRCWGQNDGQLGDGTSTTRLRPVIVKAPSGAGPLTGIVTAIRTGGLHSCAAISDLTARCWGFNSTAQLGDGTRVGRSLPVTVKNPSGTGPLTQVTQVAAGHRHSCAVLADSTARCWGWNEDGQLGNGSTTDRALPVTVKRGT